MTNVNAKRGSGRASAPSARARKRASLTAYRAKRNFGRTGEPKGSQRPKPRTADGSLLYVMQKHRARRVHFDLRLELDGVLKSWAITKGPSLDTSQKRLAVRTEDHPLEYGSFEGTIAQEEYGAGAVMLWDHGTWAAQEDPREGLEKGALKFTLHGKRLKGGFALVRLPPRNKEKRENWLFVKERDGMAGGPDPGREWTKSIATGRTFDEIAAAQKVLDSNAKKPPRTEAKKPSRQRKKAALPLPAFRAPQLATLALRPPSGEHWLHEIKFDGYRLMASMAQGETRLYTRSGLDWTKKFGGLSDAIAQLPARSALIDGEAVVIDENGRSDFGRLQHALKTGREPLHFYAFDLLELEGNDISRLNLAERKARLLALLQEAPAHVLYSDHMTGDGEKILRECCRMGLEGIVSKRSDKPYVSRRSPFWIKTKCTGRDEFVIGGWRPSEKKARPFSSLLLGEFEQGALRYRGRAGTGFDAEQLSLIAGKLRRLASNTRPFADVPAAVARRARWVKPRLVAEIAYAERTRDGYLRHPSFIGLREDKPASEVEMPPAINRNARPNADGPRTKVTLSHPDKVLFADTGITKAGVAAYWQRVAGLALPHIQNRPLSLVRCPEGDKKDCFFQRHYTPGLPKAMRPAPIAGSDGKRENYLTIEDAAGLEAAAQIGALELHIWGAHVDSIERPDRLVFDLDPGPETPFAQVKDAAKEFRALLEAAGLTSFPLLTGGKGIHIVAPLAQAIGWDELKGFAKAVATRLAAEDPLRFTASMSKSRRSGKIYIDYLRNERGASAIAPYSPRVRPMAPIAAPVSWSELSRIKRADAYTVATLPRRLRSLRERDPWEGYFDLEQRISQAALRIFSPARNSKV